MAQPDLAAAGVHAPPRPSDNKFQRGPNAAWRDEAGCSAATGHKEDCGFVVTCEHGGNRIPAPYRALFDSHEASLDPHRGYDPGALVMAKGLATALAAPLLAATVSRLLVDLNRSVSHPHLHDEAVAAMPVEWRRQILARHYRPYRSEAERLLRQAIRTHHQVIHISSHSFSPELDGQTCEADIGLLYDPTRPGEAELCEHWKAALKLCAPALVVRRNYPYGGKSDGLTSWLRRRLPPDAYLGIELEVNQKHVFRAGRAWTAVRAAIVASLRRALASRSAEFCP